MSKICPVVTIVKIEPIPGSKLVKVTLDNLIFGPFVVTGDHYVTGQLGLFIPDGAIVPEKLLREMWLWGFAPKVCIRSVYSQKVQDFFLIF